MPRTKKPLAVANYNPALLQLFIRGAEKEVRIDLPTLGRARTLRSRLHALRRAMEREEHAYYPIAARCQVSVKEGGIVSRDGTDAPSGILYVRPADSAFLTAIEKAGITIPEPPAVQEQDDQKFSEAFPTEGTEGTERSATENALDAWKEGRGMGDD